MNSSRSQRLVRCTCQIYETDIFTLQQFPARIESVFSAPVCVYRFNSRAKWKKLLKIRKKMASALQQFARKMSSAAANEIKHVTIIGGGLMGSGIAQVAASSGYDVALIEVNDQLATKAKENIKKSLARVARKQFKENEDAQQKFIEETIARIDGTSDLTKSVKATDLVIEAIVENMKVKHELFSKIDAIAPSHTIFASNTSSLPITEIASITKRKDRFGGLHFFNPVPIMRLLEVIRTEETSNESFKKMMAFGESLGKTCITCKDTPGFVVNRLLVPYMAEALRMLERGDASARDIDTAMKLGAGYPMGPIELVDYVGLDTNQSILKGWHEKYPDNPLYKPIKLLDKMIEEKKFGAKSGEGFYKYNK